MAVRLLVVLGMFSACASAADAPSDLAFEAGIERTREGRFDEALEAFLAARAAGDRSARLHFNLGVVYYRLARLDEARTAFQQAARDAETADLATYNLGLVALAADQRNQAAQHFRQVRHEAREPALRALAERALDKALGRTAASGRGSLGLLRGSDSNVVVPVGAVGDVPTATRDTFWEARVGWAGAFSGELPGLGYRLSGVALEYDDVATANLGFMEAGLDWRGPFTLGADASVLTVGDRGYQQATDLRLSGAVYQDDAVRVVYEAAQSWLDALDARARALDGARLVFGATMDVQAPPLIWSLGLRRTLNDRRAAALSPEQTAFSLRMRYGRGRFAGRVWVRQTWSDYPTLRHDELSEYGADLALRLFGPCDLLIEATRLDNSSSEDAFAFTSDRLYAGLRLRF